MFVIDSQGLYRVLVSNIQHVMWLKFVVLPIFHRLENKFRGRTLRRKRMLDKHNVQKISIDQNLLDPFGGYSG
jgi:hypothetical protein